MTPSEMSNRATWRSTLGAALVYLTLAILLWWHVWTGHPSGVMTCACTDAGRTVWFLQWVATALAHGHNPLYSTALFHPRGVNLLTDTSVPALGVLFAPVTWIFGPVVTMNLASTLVPAADALALFWLARRYVRWTPAAFIGGLAFGFSAFVLVQLSYGWLNLASLFLLPLMVGCLDELVIRQRRPPLPVGLALGGLTGLQFFLSTELLLLAAGCVAVGLVLLVGFGLLVDRRELQNRLPHALRGLGSAAATALVLLAWPTWFFLAGPGHLGNHVWSTDVPGDLGNQLSNFWSSLGLYGPVTTGLLASAARTLGGYLGPAGPAPSYLGVSMISISLAGMVVWWKDGRLRFFGILAILAGLASLRIGPHHWRPWSLVAHLPLVDNVVQSRISAIIDLCVALLLAIVLDRVRHALPRRWPAPSGPLISGAIAVLALGPLAWVLAPTLPFVVQSTSVPRWFTTTSATSTTDQVVATYPFTTADSQAGMPWQAISGLHFSLAGGGGPTGTALHAGRERPGFQVLHDASILLAAPPALDQTHLEQVLHAFRAWGVTEIVVPDGTGLPAYQLGRGTAYGVGFMTVLTGQRPTFEHDAWVWPMSTVHEPAPVFPAWFAACTSLPTRDWTTIPSCLLDQDAWFF